MSNWKIVICLFIVVFMTKNILGQSETFGIVKDAETGEALIGVNILIVGTKEGTSTDVDGRFRIKNDKKDLQFSYVGFKTKTLKKPIGEVDVRLEESDNGMIPGVLPLIIDRRIASAHNYSVLDKNILSLQNKAELSSILNTSTGVLMHSGALNTNRITIRGIGNRSPFSTNKIKAYLNEIPLTTGTGETTIEDIDLSFIKDIQIWKGPVGSRYGAGLGGMILLNTIDQQKERSYFSLKNSIGSFGLLRNTVDGHFWDPTKKVDVHLNLNATQSDGYRDNNEYERKGITLLANKKFKKNTLSLLLNYTTLKAFIPSSLNENDYLNSPTKAAFTWGNVKGFEDYNKVLAGLSFEQKIKYDLTINYALFLNQKDSYESRPFNILDEKSNSVGGRVVLNYFRNFLQGTNYRIGTEVFRENYDWQTFVTNDGVQGNELSNNKETRAYANVFGEAIFRFSDRLKLNTGLNFNTTKYDLVDEFNVDSLNQTGDHSFDPIFSPRITLSYSYMQNRDFYVMASHGFAPPSLEETLAPDGSINTTIQPETAWNFEIGTRFFPTGNERQKLRYEISLFTMLVNDLLVARRTALDQYIGINAGKTTHTGLEAHLDYRLLNKNRTTLDLALNYTYSNFKFKEFIDDDNDFSGNELTGTSPHLLNAILFYKNKNFYSNLNFQYVDSQPLTDANTIYSDAYSLLNFKLGYQFQLAKKWQFDVYAGLNNIFNEKYASMHQINASSFGGNAPRYYYPGLPRNYYVGLDLKYRF